MDLLTPSSNGVFQLCLLPQIAPGYLGEGCHASHQPSDASTPFSFTDHHAKCRIHTSNGMNIKHAHRICDNADRRTERSLFSTNTALLNAQIHFTSIFETRNTTDNFSGDIATSLHYSVSGFFQNSSGLRKTGQLRHNQNITWCVFHKSSSLVTYRRCNHQTS